MFLETLELFFKTRSSKIYSSPRLSTLSYIKKTKVNVEILADIDISLLVGEGIRGVICHGTH